MATIAGNPQDYMIIYGGVSDEHLYGNDTNTGVYKVK